MKQQGLALVITLALVFIVSCDNGGNSLTENLKKELISAKWNVNGSGSYISFEFNMDGNYIAVKNTSLPSSAPAQGMEKNDIAPKNVVTKSTDDNTTVFFGTYRIVDDTTIELSGLGTLKVSKLNNNSISFTINGEEVNASKQVRIASSTNTELLCRTWKLISFGGEELNDSNLGMREYIILFSNAGTYFANAILENGEHVTALGSWIWCNQSQDQLAFTAPAYGNELDCNSKYIFKDIQLTENSFIGINMENEYPMELVMEAN